MENLEPPQSDAGARGSSAPGSGGSLPTGTASRGSPGTPVRVPPLLQATEPRALLRRAARAGGGRGSAGVWPDRFSKAAAPSPSPSEREAGLH